MATYTDSLGFDKGSAAYTDRGLHKVSVMEVELDFAEIAAARAAAGATAFGAADVLEVLPIPANTVVLGAGLECTTVEGSAATLSVGDGADADGFLAASSVNALASYGGVGTAAIYAAAGGKFYAAADTIDVTMSAGLAAAKVRVWAIVVDCNGSV